MRNSSESSKRMNKCRRESDSFSSTPLHFNLHANYGKGWIQERSQDHRARERK